MVTEIVMFLVTYALCNVNGHNCAANSMHRENVSLSEPLTRFPVSQLNNGNWINTSYEKMSFEPPLYPLRCPRNVRINHFDRRTKT